MAKVIGMVEGIKSKVEKKMLTSFFSKDEVQLYYDFGFFFSLLFFSFLFPYLFLSQRVVRRGIFCQGLPSN